MSDSNLFVKRPTSEETEDDILQMQQQWESQKKSSVQVKKMSKTKPSEPKKSIPEKNFNESARFTIDLESIEEEWDAQRVVFNVEEKNASFLESDKSDELMKLNFEKSKYSENEGFPDILDLRAYYGEGDVQRQAPKGKSFFAAEFDRLCGRIDDAVLPPSNVPDDEEEDSGDFESENKKYIASLDQDKIQELQNEIKEHLDPKLMAFLAERQKKREESKEPPKPKPKVSRFKQSRENKQPIVPEVEPTTSKQPENPVVDDLVKQLEVLDEFADRAEEENYNRLATDAVQIDFATKCLRTMLPRQQQNAIRLFDNLKSQPPGYVPDSLIDLARSKIDDVKMLYMEEMSVDGKSHLQFAAGSNPLIDSCWTLRPIRRVLDVLQKRESDELTDDDLDIVRLSLLWTLLLLVERPSAFYSFAEPAEMYVRLAETLLLGHKLLSDDHSIEAITRLMNLYVIKMAKENKLCLRMTSKVAELDAFMPFYEDLVKHFEIFSLGDVCFTRIILVGAYMNSAVGDSLECRFAIWTPKKHTARQMTVTIEDAKGILDHIRENRERLAQMYEEQHYVGYTSLLGAYTSAIRDEQVTRDRNPLLFTIAAEELGSFVKRHQSQQTPEKSKEFATLVELIRSSVKTKLDI